MPNDSRSCLGLTRGGFLANSAGATMPLPSAVAASAIEPHQATGTRVGEVSASSTIVWTRLTKHPLRNNEGVVVAKKVDRSLKPTPSVPVEQIEGVCPGMAGRVRLRYGVGSVLSCANETAWVCSKRFSPRRRPVRGWRSWSANS